MKEREVKERLMIKKGEEMKGMRVKLSEGVKGGGDEGVRG